MKYQYEINNPENSHGKILAHIPQGANILECGCATGYMTKFLQEQKSCSVSIVECEKEAFALAQPYAVDGYCGDLMEDAWAAHFPKQSFDFVLFADVLEHLTRPEKALQHAIELLKEDGTILVSIPNVAHNDILIKLLHNRWDYTATGLLDDTHVHFWGAENLAAFFEKAGLKITCLESVNVPTFSTEQLVSRKLSREAYHLLQNRQYGEVYQFVLTLQKQEYVAAHHILLQNRLPAQSGFALQDDLESVKVASLFYTAECGNYSESSRRTFPYEITPQIRVCMEEEVPDAAVEFRVDPVEMPCIVSSIQVCCNGIPLNCKVANGTRVDTALVFAGNDPQLLYDLPAEKHRVLQVCFTLCFDTELIQLLLRKVPQNPQESEADEKVRAEEQ